MNTQVGMDIRNSNATAHLKTAGSALVNWWRAATLDALIVGVLWLIGLELIRVPWAPFWAILGGLLQIIPTFGGMIALIGPVLAVAFSGSRRVASWPRPRPLRPHRHPRRPRHRSLRPAPHHESSLVGSLPRPHRPRHHHPLLGSAARPAAARGHLRVSQARATQSPLNRHPSLYRVSANR